MPDQVGHDVKWEELTSVFGVNNLIYKGVSQTVIPRILLNRKIPEIAASSLVRVGEAESP